MNKIVKYCLFGAGIVVGICLLVYLMNPKAVTKMIVGHGNNFTNSYTTLVGTGETDGVIGGTTHVNGIILGSDTSSAAVALYDQTTSVNGSNPPVVIFSGSTLHGFYPINLDFNFGVTSFVTSETGVTLITSNP